MTVEQRLAELGLDLDAAQALRAVALGARVEGAAAERSAPDLERRGLLRRGPAGYEPTATGIVVARQLDAIFSSESGAET